MIGQAGFTPVVHQYITLDARLGWRPCPNLEMALIGQNLLQDHHLEFGTNPIVGAFSYLWRP